MEKPCYAFIPILPWWKVKYYEIKWAYTDEKTRVYMIKMQLSKPSTQVQNVKGWNWARQLFHFVIYGFSTFKVHAIIRVALTLSTTSSCSVHMHGLQSFFQPTRILYITHFFQQVVGLSVSSLKRDECGLSSCSKPTISAIPVLTQVLLLLDESNSSQVCDTL